MVRALVEQLPFLQKWAHGRLPQRARRRMETGDLVQETLVRVLQQLGELDSSDPQKLQNYLTSAIRNRVKDEVHRASLGEVTNGALDDRENSSHSALDELIESEDSRRYRSALLALPEAERNLLVARIDLGFRYEDLASALGYPSPGAARMAARRATLRLAREMGMREKTGGAVESVGAIGVSRIPE